MTYTPMGMKCDCAEMTCPNNCTLKHTHKTFFCEFCKPALTRDDMEIPPVSEPSLQGKIEDILIRYHDNPFFDFEKTTKAIFALVGNEEKLQPLKPLPDTHPSKSPLPDTHPTPTPPPTQWEEEFEEKFNHGNYYTFEDGDATGLKDFIRSLLQKQRLEVIDGAIEIVRTNSKLSKKYDVSGIRVGYEAAVDDLISELTNLRGGV